MYLSLKEEMFLPTLVQGLQVKSFPLKKSKNHIPFQMSFNAVSIMKNQSFTIILSTASL